MRRLSRSAAGACASLGVLLGAGGYTVHYSEAAAYLSDDPRSCVNCHVMRDHYDGWQKASHHTVATCNDCHLPQAFLPRYVAKAENGFWHSKGFTLQDFREPIRIRPENRAIVGRNCLRCHDAFVSEVEHRELDCVRCHDAVGHGPTR